MDFLLLIIKRLLPRLPKLKLILMSATMDATVFSGYFGGCPIIEAPGRTFPVEVSSIAPVAQRELRAGKTVAVIHGISFFCCVQDRWLEDIIESTWYDPERGHGLSADEECSALQTLHETMPVSCYEFIVTCLRASVASCAVQELLTQRLVMLHRAMRITLIACCWACKRGRKSMST